MHPCIHSFAHTAHPHYTFTVALNSHRHSHAHIHTSTHNTLSLLCLHQHFICLNIMVRNHAQAWKESQGCTDAEGTVHPAHWLLPYPPWAGELTPPEGVHTAASLCCMGSRGYLSLVIESKTMANISHNQLGGQSADWKLCKKGVTWLDTPTQAASPFWEQT